MNTYSTSTGERITQLELDKRIRQAKERKKEEWLDKWNYFFCEDCMKSSQPRYDMSHDISVQECKMSGRAELAYDTDNIKIRCRKCHNILDKLNLQR